MKDVKEKRWLILLSVCVKLLNQFFDFLSLIWSPDQLVEICEPYKMLS